MEKNEKKCQVHLLAVKNCSKIWMNTHSDNSLSYYDYEQHACSTGQALQIYITSDDEIKEGDWCYHLGFNRIEQWKNSDHSVCDISLRRKIIATTDKSLTISKVVYPEELVHPLPQPSESFIQVFIDEYNKGNKIEWVMVEYVFDSSFDTMDLQMAKLTGTKIDSLPKVNPKDNCIVIRKVKEHYTIQELLYLCESAFNHEINGLPHNTVIFNEWKKSKGI